MIYVQKTTHCFLAQLKCSAARLITKIALWAPPSMGKKGTCPLWKCCKVFLCISSYSKTLSRRIIYALFSQPVVSFWSFAPDPSEVQSLDPAGGLSSHTPNLPTHGEKNFCGRPWMALKYQTGPIGTIYNILQNLAKAQLVSKNPYHNRSLITSIHTTDHASLYFFHQLTHIDNDDAML